MGARDYGEATKKALFTLSFGRCYEPDCHEKVVKFADDGTPIVLVQIAHISGASPSGPRYNTKKSNDERRSFTNLLLLCTFHHGLVDKKPTGDKYDDSELIRWKQARENEIASDLSPLTEAELLDSLGGALRDVINSTRVEVLSAIGEVEKTSRDSAQLLRKLVDRTFNGPNIDSDLVASLAASAKTLNGIGDYVPMLHESSQSFARTLPDYAPMLHDSSRTMQRMPDYIAMLYSSSKVWQNAPDWITQLDDITRQLSSFRDLTPGLIHASNEFSSFRDVATGLMRASDQLSNSSYYASGIQSATSSASDVADELAQVVGEVEYLRQSGFVGDLRDSAMAANEAALVVRDSVRELERAPDRWTFYWRGAAGGAIAVIIVGIVIWYLMAHA